MFSPDLIRLYNRKYSQIIFVKTHFSVPLSSSPKERYLNRSPSHTTYILSSKGIGLDSNHYFLKTSKYAIDKTDIVDTLYIIFIFVKSIYNTIYIYIPAIKDF